MNILISSDQEAKIIQNRILFTETTLAELCHAFGTYVRKTARLRDAGDEIAKVLQHFSVNENINKSLAGGMESFARCLYKISSYADMKIQILERKIINEFTLYEEICKHVKEDVRDIYNAKEKEVTRKRHLDRIRDRSPRNSQQIVQAETALVKASTEVTKSIQNLEEKTNEFEKHKLHDIKAIFQDFISVEIGYHSRVLEVLTKAYKQIDSIDEESDLEEFKKSMDNLHSEMKKKSKSSSHSLSFFKSSQSLGSLGGIFGSSKNKSEGIPKSPQRHQSEDMLNSMKIDLSESENSISITADSDDDVDEITETEEKSSPYVERKKKH